MSEKKWHEEKPCDHPGCMSHVSHPCEGCGRQWGRPKRKFPYGMTKLYREILTDVFGGEATDKQLSDMVTLMWDIADDEFDTHCRRITEDDALEWIARAVKIARSK